jgi:hypothetical protein
MPGWRKGAVRALPFPAMTGGNPDGLPPTAIFF